MDEYQEPVSAHQEIMSHNLWDQITTADISACLVSTLQFLPGADAKPFSVRRPVCFGKKCQHAGFVCKVPKP